MNEPIFNPFLDRLSRDLRNDLSEGLTSAIESGNSGELQKIITSYRQIYMAECYRDYLEDRCRRYEKALKRIGTNMPEPLQCGLILWDLGLFFEMHEVLEHSWYSAEGPMKAALQAMIRAAGVYIKREFGFHDSAGRIAEKAVPVLTENRNMLAALFDVEELIKALRNPNSAPPQLWRGQG